MKEYNAIELRDIVQRLMGGYIRPLGSTGYDNEAYKRQKTMQDLVGLLIGDIIDVTDCTGSQASISKARNEAVGWMNDQKDYLEEILGNVIEEEGADNE